ncbi:unnamed protein product (mitochondrion) [Plasmodiophora brassicae]|uniref:Uncharacterized protein n=1 Tax=Plasmodiophora brassicae TaxID=37360 RepID=A0A0G4J1N8_PLABS|nr:hypothetical protein PBRA_002038 [Plasmodiophora brassicae]SPR01446.1 unnamed protein product [Plasmodiophora brassicae]
MSYAAARGRLGEWRRVTPVAGDHQVEERVPAKRKPGPRCVSRQSRGRKRSRFSGNDDGGDERGGDSDDNSSESDDDSSDSDDHSSHSDDDDDIDDSDHEHGQDSGDDDESHGGDVDDEEEGETLTENPRRPFVRQKVIGVPDLLVPYLGTGGHRAHQCQQRKALVAHIKSLFDAHYATDRKCLDGLKKKDVRRINEKVCEYLVSDGVPFNVAECWPVESTYNSIKNMLANEKRKLQHTAMFNPFG